MKKRLLSIALIAFLCVANSSLALSPDPFNHYEAKVKSSDGNYFTVHGYGLATCLGKVQDEIANGAIVITHCTKIENLITDPSIGWPWQL